jgi:glycosyltransferase involved in cell wall biosynthesis
LLTAASFIGFLILLLSERPRIAHVTVASPADLLRSLPFGLAARLSGASVLLQFHYDVGDPFLSLQRPVQLIVRRSYRCFQKLCFLSESLRQDFVLKVGQYPSAVVPNAVPSEYLGRPPLALEGRDRRVIFLGRFVEEKGIGELLEVARRCSTTDPGLTYELYGDGPLPQAQPLTCRFHGWIEGEDKVELLRRAVALVLPSYREALPLSLLEAMASGTPVIASRVGGVADIITDEVEGRLVSSRDVEALSEAIARVTGDPDFWTHCSRNGYNSAQKYRPEVIGKKWVSLYAQLLR